MKCGCYRRWLRNVSLCGVAVYSISAEVHDDRAVADNMATKRLVTIDFIFII